MLAVQKRKDARIRRGRYKPKPFTRIVKNDFRNLIGQMFTNVLNLADPLLMQQFSSDYFVPTCHLSSAIEGNSSNLLADTRCSAAAFFLGVFYITPDLVASVNWIKIQRLNPYGNECEVEVEYVVRGVDLMGDSRDWVGVSLRAGSSHAYHDENWVEPVQEVLKAQLQAKILSDSARMFVTRTTFTFSLNNDLQVHHLKLIQNEDDSQMISQSRLL